MEDDCVFDIEQRLEKLRKQREWINQLGDNPVIQKKQQLDVASTNVPSSVGAASRSTRSLRPKFFAYCLVF